MAALLALLSAAVYGAADFLGGVAARRVPTLTVVIVSQGAGLLLLGVLLPALPDAGPSARDLRWGVAAGLAGGAGVALLYRALAVGVMAVIAPVTAACAVAVPVLAGVLLGERPGAATLAGIVLALAAIALVSQQTAPARDPAARARGRQPAGLGLALASGVAIGLFYLALARTADAAGLWPLVTARGASIALFTVAAALTRVPLALPRRDLVLVAACGGLDMLANALYLLAVRQGTLTLVVPLASLYPASTVLLAASILRERLNAVQVLGVACAVIAVVLIAGGGGQ